MKTLEQKRMAERESAEFMIRLYCRKYHQKEGLCADCSELLNYVYRRLEHCPYMENKHFCAHCPKNCYQKQKRQQMKELMRKVGPMLLWRRPQMAIKHMIGSILKRKGAQNGNTENKR